MRSALPNRIVTSGKPSSSSPVLVLKVPNSINKKTKDTRLTTMKYVDSHLVGGGQSTSKDSSTKTSDVDFRMDQLNNVLSFRNNSIKFIEVNAQGHLL